MRRFRAAFISEAALEGVVHADEIVDAELESWPEQDEPPVEGFYADWMTELPEAAVAENLSYWTE